MPKKRNCRRNEQERQIHEKAVSLRKLTDQQLVDYMEQRYACGLEAGKVTSENEPNKAPENLTKQIIAALKEMKGVGITTIHRVEVAIEKVLEK